MCQNTAAATSSGGDASKYCVLCGNQNIQQLTRYNNLTALEREFLCKHLDNCLSEDNYICKKHWIEAKRYHNTANYTPKWKNSAHAQTPPKLCIHPQCTSKFSDKLVKPAFANVSELEDFLGVKSSSSAPFLLCPCCYREVHRLFNPEQRCSSCGATPKPGQKFYRRCPNPVIISKYLQDTSDTNILISPDDCICTSCYNTHCSIIKSIESDLHGSDQMLLQSIKEWEITKDNTSTDQLTKAILSSVIYVAKSLLLQKALLLPWVCEVFLNAYGFQSTDGIKSIILEVGDSNVQYSSWWLLHQLIAHLDGYMMHRCVHMKFGTVLYRKGGDVLVALSWALNASQPLNQYQSQPEYCHKNPDVGATLKEASIVVNDLIHEEIKKSSVLSSTNCSLLDINKELNNTNPLLLKFLTNMTNSAQRRESCNSTEHIKKIRLYFILSLLKFCANPRKPMPIHNLIADTTEVCGGSRQLIRILNRLGCAASPDTHDRFVTQHAMAQRKLKVWDDISSSTFTIASVDNFDMLRSHAAVYCGDQQRSYHGTTLQLVQPDPTSLLLPTSLSETVVNPSGQFEVATTINVLPADQQPKPSNYSSELGTKRKRTVQVKSLTSSLSAETSPVHITIATNLAFHNFLQNSSEIIEKNSLHELTFSYILQKHILHHHANLYPANKSLSEFRLFMEDNNKCGQSQPSTVYYMELLNENPDCTETMSLVAEDLLSKFDGVQDGWVLLVGDGKTYKHLMSIKKQYNTALQKLLVFPGDWHILKNYQPILIKLYYAAGLKEIAKKSGYQGTTLKSIEQCSNFKRTHYFLLQVWEALYREMLHAYLNASNNTITKDANCILLSSIQENKPPEHTMKRIRELVRDSQTNETFKDYIDKTDQTWKFWAQFVFRDCLCYFGLYLAVRSSNWELRVASLKQMAPAFSAFDREYYARILPHHLAQIQLYPSVILECLQKGGFTVNLTGQKWKAVALDEAHEMCVNKDLKTAVVRPTEPYLQKTSLFFNHHIKLYKNLMQQLFPERSVRHEQPSDILDSSPQAQRYEENIKEMCNLIVTKGLLPVTQCNDRGLLNVFTGQQATHEQANDMLTFYEIGEQSFHNYIKYHILQISSVNLRQHKLITMATSKPNSTRSTTKERETKQVITCLRQRLAWVSQKNQPYTKSQEQYSELPRALCDEDGNPHKGNKSTWTQKLSIRYQKADPPVFTATLPVTPQAVIIDAMFTINTKPLRLSKTFSDYACFLFEQFVTPHFRAGAREVHLIFDKPSRGSFNPKQYEQKRQYKENPEHQHYSFTPTTTIPNNWQEHLQCPQCKCCIVEAIGLSLLQKGHHLLKDHQHLIIAGCFAGLGENDAWLIHAGEVSAERPVQYWTNAKEADSRIWQHAVQCHANIILIHSPDTDVYNIGLSHINQRPTALFIIQLNLPHSDEKKYININNFTAVLQ